MKESPRKYNNKENLLLLVIEMPYRVVIEKVLPACFIKVKNVIFESEV